MITLLIESSVSRVTHFASTYNSKFTVLLLHTATAQYVLVLPLEISSSRRHLSPPPRVASREFISFHSFREKSPLVVLPRGGLRLHCAIGNRRPATCWLEGKSHLFKFSSRRSLRGEARSLGASRAWLTSCVTSIMHVLRHRRTLGVSPLPK